MRKTFRKLTDEEKEKIVIEFHLYSLRSLAFKYEVSTSMVQSIVTEFLQNKRIDVKGLCIYDIMKKYKVTVTKAIQIKNQFDRTLHGHVYFGQVKEAIYSNEDEMMIPSYSVKDLQGDELLILKTI
jgi:Mor family transcriptional regulator